MINKNKILISSLGILVGGALVVYLGTSIIPKALITLTRASTVQSVSVGNSILIGQKIMASADGIEKCVVNVFILDKDNKGIPNRLVQLSGLGSINEAVTDDLGKAVFELTSNQAGQYELMAEVGGVSLNSTMKVTFR